METNDFLLYNEVLYRLHACRTMEELKPTLLGQLKLMIPYTYASFLSIQVDPETQELVHRDPFCQPRQFEAAERAWLGQIDQSYSIWLSHAPESMVVRDSEILSGDNRFSAPRDEKSRTFSSNSRRSHILRTSSRSIRLILSSIVSLAVWLKCTRTI